MLESEIKEARTAEEILACFPVLKELYEDKLRDKSEFLERIQDQQSERFHLMYIEEGSIVVAATGFRILNTLFSRKTLIIHDLCTLASVQGRGLAGKLIDWVIRHARQERCDAISLDSGYHRHSAHRFYLNKGFYLASHRMQMDLCPTE